MKLKIIYEDNDIIVIDKPSGLLVHGMNENDKSETIVSLLYIIYPEIKSVGENPLRPGIVHRLDKETSGLMVIAKNNETFYELKKLFQERKVEKKYIALVSGVLEKESGIIDKPLMKMGARTRIFNFQFSIFKQSPNAQIPKEYRQALTAYKVLKRYNDYTLVEVTPKTGRQHQIRVHFASINHPVACDKLYGRKAKKCPALSAGNVALSATPKLSRHFLHATYLKFRLKNALMEFDSGLPQDLETTLLNLK